VAAAGVNAIAQYTLHRGEVLQFAQAAELTGSVVQSDRPMAVFGAHECLAIPDGVGGCDPAHQQLPPVRALGHAHVAAPHPARAGEAAFHWRVTGVVDGTLLAFSPAQPGAPVTLQAGQTVDFTTAGPFTVTAQDAAHPYLLSAFMTGGAPFDGDGDPEWLVVPPLADAVDDATFPIDPTFPDARLVVARAPSGPGTFADVVLDCVGPLSGWTAVGGVEVTTIPLVIDDVAPACASGAHRLTSQGGFLATLWSRAAGSSAALTASPLWRELNDLVIAPQPR
jgi:hypothetical protein